MLILVYNIDYFLKVSNFKDQYFLNWNNITKTFYKNRYYWFKYQISAKFDMKIFFL